jgi:hypothetical protein
MTLTISQLQHMYGTSSVKELRGASPSGSSRKAEADVLEPSTANSSNEIIPEEDNPLFMSVEQRAWAHQREEILQHQRERQEIQRQIAEGEKSIEAMKRERAAFEALSPEEQIIYDKQRQQRELESYRAHQAKEAIRVEKLKASLPPRVEGALGEDLRLAYYYDLKRGSFLEEMKVKYAHNKDALFAPDQKLKEAFVSHLASQMIYDPEEHALQSKINNLPASEVAGMAKQKIGNSFVMGLFASFDTFSMRLNNIYHNRNMMQSAERDMAEGNVRSGLKEQIAQHKQTIEETQQLLHNELLPVKYMIEDRGLDKEAAAFFADASLFFTGNTYNLNDVYREAGII